MAQLAGAKQRGLAVVPTTEEKRSAEEDLFGDEKLVRFEIKLASRTPLLLNPLTDEKLRDIRDKNTRPTGKGWTPEKEAESKLFKSDDGKLGLPAQYLFACLKRAGVHVPFKNKKMISRADGESLLGSFLEIPPECEFIPFETCPGWKTDIQAGRNKNGEAVPVVRPKINQWTLCFPVVVDLSMVTEETVQKLFFFAGKCIGLGSFRCQKGSNFGKFRLTGWKKIREE